MSYLKFFTPTNLAEEKERFFASNSYHPTFRYDWSEEALKTWVEKQSKYTKLAAAMLSQDSLAISQSGMDLYETEVNTDLLEEAKEILKNPPEKLPQPSEEEIITAFSKAFKQLGLSEYSLQLSDKRGFFFRPNYKNKSITASKHANFEYFSIDGEVKHELTHIIRYENGLSNGIDRSTNYLPTEEGLAAYFQDYSGNSGMSSLFQHAAEYAVTEIGLKGSLRDMIVYLRSLGFSQDLAWQRASRHKFGFIDTSKPGDNMKPSMYYYHEQKVHSLTEGERLRLLQGKISINELRSYPTYQGRINPEVLMDFYSF